MADTSKGQSSGAAPDNARKELYPLCGVLFTALIEVEVWSGDLLRNSERFANVLRDHASLSELWYVPPADPSDDEDIQTMIQERRKEMPKHFQTVWRAADYWHKSESRLREAIQKAKIAADNAGVELDTSSTPPLQRTSIAIKRALQNLGGSVPFGRSTGWADGASKEAVDRVTSALRPVREWTNELRLLVQPEHTMPPPGWKSSQEPLETAARTPKSPRRPSRVPKLSERELDVMQGLHDMGALFEERARVTAPKIAKAAFGDENDGLTKDVLAKLKGAGLVGSKTGRRGGSWLTKKGVGRLYEERPETRGNSREPSLRVD